jgi:hypothetical protein
MKKRLQLVTTTANATVTGYRPLNLQSRLIAAGHIATLGAGPSAVCPSRIINRIFAPVDPIRKAVNRIRKMLHRIEDTVNRENGTVNRKNIGVNRSVGAIC